MLVILFLSFWLKQIFPSRVYLVCGYLAVYNFSQVHPGGNVFASNIAEWGTALFSISLATNIIVTSLIGQDFCRHVRALCMR